MSDAKFAAKRAIEKIRRAPAGLGQVSALSSLISGVEEFVGVLQAENELASEIPKMQKELTELQNELNQADLDRDDERSIQMQIADLSGTIQEAETARRSVDSNRSTLRSLNKDVESLRSSISKALG